MDGKLTISWQTVVAFAILAALVYGLARLSPGSIAPLVTALVGAAGMGQLKPFVTGKAKPPEAQ